MPRIRYLKPDFFLDEDIGYLTVINRLTYAGLWCHADRLGRLEDRPRYLKTQLFPYDDIDMEQILSDLAQPKTTCPKKTFITRYEVNGQKYIQINKFLDHQKPHHTERKSIIPPPPTVNSALIDGEPREGIGIGIGKKIYGKERHGKGMGSEEGKGEPVSGGANNGGNAEGHPPVAPTPEELNAQAILLREREARGIPISGRKATGGTA